MMRWLDALGAFKWPSLALVTAPLAAYPFWLPEPAPAPYCSSVVVDGRGFDVFKHPDAAEAVLRPVRARKVAAPTVEVGEPLRFDAGAMVVDAEPLRWSGIICSTK